MFFNGFTLLLVFASIAVGFFWGMSYENQYQKTRFNNWLHGETIEEEMKRDGWKI
jgi:cell division protein FtsW (lipid II flippase)